MLKITKFKNIILTLSSTLVWLLLSGCAGTVTQKDIDEILTNKKGGVAVIGMEAKNYASLGNYSPRVDVAAVKDDGDQITLIPVSWSYPTGSLNDGFAFISLPESKYGESYVVLNYAGNSGGAFFSTVCEYGKTNTFKIKNGDFVYVGHFSVIEVPSTGSTYRWRVSFTRNYSAALSHVEKLFPDAAKHLEPARLETRTSTFGSSCS